MIDWFKFKAWIPSFKKWADKVVINGDGTHTCYAKGQLKSYFGIPDEYIELSEKSLLVQCTGLKDKNGVLIYEGDVVIYGKTNGKPFYAVVEWEGAMFGLRVYESKDFVYFDSELAETAHLYEVAGNKFQNPELLELTND